MANEFSSQIVNSYTTFSGIDITAIFDNLILATLSGIAVSLTREKVPVYTMGSANARSISRGKRACAGSLQFTLFDRDAFYNLFLDASHFYYAHADEVNYLTNPKNISEFTGLFFGNDSNASGSNPFNNISSTGTGLSGTGLDAPGSPRGLDLSSSDVGNGPVVGKSGANGNQGATSGNPDARVGALSIRRSAQHADQVYPFDITLVAQNEYGRASACAVIGVEIINEGGGVSVDDITNEQQMTYIAIVRTPWVPLTEDGAKETLIGKINSITPNIAGTDKIDLSGQNNGVYNGVNIP